MSKCPSINMNIKRCNAPWMGISPGSLSSLDTRSPHHSLRTHCPHSKQWWLAKSQNPWCPMEGGSLCLEGRENWHFDDDEEERTVPTASLLQSFIFILHLYLWKIQRHSCLSDERAEAERVNNLLVLECNLSPTPSLAVSRSALCKSLQWEGTTSH